MTASDTSRAIDAVWRIESARLIAGLTRIVRDVGLAEDLAQDALVAALQQWPESGVPDNPGAWLMAVAKRRSIDLIRRRLNPSLGIGGVLLTMVDSRTRLAQDVEAEVRRHFGPLVFKTSVPRSVRLAEAPSHGLPAIAYDRNSAGADAYWKVAMELVERR